MNVHFPSDSSVNPSLNKTAQNHPSCPFTASTLNEHFDRDDDAISCAIVLFPSAALGVMSFALDDSRGAFRTEK